MPNTSIFPRKISHVAPRRFAPLRLAPLRLAPLRLAPLLMAFAVCHAYGGTLVVGGTAGAPGDGDGADGGAGGSASAILAHNASIRRSLTAGTAAVRATAVLAAQAAPRWPAP